MLEEESNEDTMFAGTATTPSSTRTNTSLLIKTIIEARCMCKARNIKDCISRLASSMFLMQAGTYSYRVVAIWKARLSELVLKDYTAAIVDISSMLHAENISMKVFDFIQSRFFCTIARVLLYIISTYCILL